MGKLKTHANEPAHVSGITVLMGTVEDLKGQIRALKTTGSAETSGDDRLFQKGEKVESLKELQDKMKKRNDELLANISEKDQELAEKEEKIKILEVTVDDQPGQIRVLRNTGSATTSSAIGGNDDLLTEIAEKETELGQQAKRIAELEKHLHATAKENEERGEKLNQFVELYKSVQYKDKEIERLKVRVAALSERRVKEDQSKVEDTLSENRQSEVEQDFANFFDHARMDARGKLETFCLFQNKIEVVIYFPRLLCLIFEAAYEKMKEARGVIFELGKKVTNGFIKLAPDQIKWITLCKTKSIPETEITYPVCLRHQESQYPVEAVDALMMTLKEKAPGCNLDCLVEDVVEVVKRKWNRWQEEEKLVRNSRLPYAVSQLHCPLFQEYIKASIRLTWRMVTLTPPLRLEYQSQYLQQCHKKMGYHMNPEVCTLVKETPDQHQKEEIACYLWPGLFDGEGRCVRKGEVLCKIRENTK